MKQQLKRNVLLAAVAGLLLALSSITTPAASQTVMIQGFAFVPNTLTVNRGDTVTWMNQDPVPHTSTSDATPAVWDSGLLSQGQSFPFTFNTAGTFAYHCTVHPFMHGSVTVGQAASTPPVVQITSPAAGAVFTMPTNVTITATASSAGGTIAKVEFLDGATSVGIVTTAPYSVTIMNITAGSHQLTAKATDAAGTSTVSAPVMIQVNAPSSTGPVVQITSPANEATFSTPTNVTITATASSSGGTISKVEFLDGATSLGVVTNAPYSLTVSNVTAGSHQLTAKATDNKGAATVSASVTIQVNGPSGNGPAVQIITPGNGAVFLTPANITLLASATDTNGTIAHVEFLAGTNSLGLVSQSPYSLTWSNLPSGTYALKAIAVDDKGVQGVSARVTVSVNGAAAYLQHNLVSDLKGLADNTDTNLLNPWGIATSATSPFFISDNHAGVTTMYDTTGAVQSLVVTIPTPTNGTPPAAPTGIVFNGGSNFLVAPNLPAHFIFATEDGTIVGWNTGSNAVLMVDNSTANAVYKGLAMGNVGGNSILFATDFHNGKIDMFDDSFKPVKLNGTFFTDPAIPGGYAPFGIHTIASNLYVTYALQDTNKHDDVSGPGNGFVNVFDPMGHLLKRLASNGPLNSPWGMAMAPAGFGQFSGALLIGNFGDGQINAFDSATGAFLGSLSDAQDNPIAIDGLWALKFGNGGRGGDANRLYFTAGIAAGDQPEDHGLFGSISAIPVFRLTSIVDTGTAVTLTWAGGTGPYVLQKRTSLSGTNWVDVLTTTNRNAMAPKTGQSGFYRLKDQAPPQ